VTTFTYTEYTNPVMSGNQPSEAIDSLYYNDKTKELLVGAASSGEAYVYTGVPRHVYVAFKEAVSKGFFWNKIVKRQYGPSKDVGWTDEVDFVEYGRHLAAAGTPKGLTTNEQTKTSTNVLAFPLKSEPTVASAAVHTGDPSKAVEVQFDDAIGTTVVFSMGGDDKTVDFDDKYTVRDAVAEVSRIADMLGIGSNLVIKAVTVRFE